ncbi:MAG: hypothetical protein H0T17_01925 [Propionibacteriales bacterium]|nr:hypothetical protein [Propionibacteriales bacterium]
MATSLRLDSFVSADKLRSSPQHMRASLREVASAGKGVWTAGLPELVPVLVEVARVDLCLARLVEGHADALRIIQQAGGRPRDGVYGVWASRSAGTGVKAVDLGGTWQLSGELRFASGVDLVDRALVPVWLDRDHHLLMDIAADMVVPDPGSWQTSAMDASRTLTVRLDLESVKTEPLGSTDFYLGRPGFVVGGLCVAAVWAGGAHHVVDVVTASIRPFTMTSHQLRRIGVMEQAAWQAQTALDTVVRRLSNLPEESVAREIGMARSAVVTACEVVIHEATRVVGPAGLSRDVRLARALHDLSIYIRQHPLDNELERLGEYAVATRELLAE